MSEMPDIHSPEFRSVLFNQFLQKQEQANNSVQFVGQMDALTFDEVTPEIWAHLVNYLGDVKATAEYVLLCLASMDMFVDNPEAMEMVKDYAIKSREEG